MRMSPRSLMVLAGLLALAAAPPDARRPQPPAEASFGRGPVPTVVAMTGTEQPVSLIVRPRFMLQRGDVRVEARVSRHDSNRLLAIAWVSDVGTTGSTQRQLDGADAPVLHPLNLPGQPAANYVFVATVFNSLGKSRGRAEARIHAPESDGR